MSEAKDGRRDVLAQALVEIRSLRARLQEAEDARHAPIAVVGIGCRLPGGVQGPDELWSLLERGVDATGEPPPGRWPHADPPGLYTRRGGWLDEVESFDAGFFGISDREARSLDPQQRLLLEVSWEALEHAGLAPDSLRGQQAGVFIGITSVDYAQVLAEQLPPEELDLYVGSGTALNFAAGRIAYTLGLTGPAMAVDSACSSSLVAVHLACQSLRRSESSLALAGGVNLVLSPMGHATLCRGRALSPDGRCKTFDAGADGYARGEGCGVVVLKRLADARRDGDRVLAVIRGSAVNQDGPSSGLTVPSGPAQEAVIRAACADARIRPSELRYVEAHGTGTALGDPIELRALSAATGPGREGPLLVGALKTNIGHLEAAAGIAGLIKLVLACQHGALPAHIGLRRPNPAVDWDRLGIEVVQALRPWPAGPRLAGLSSFGASGTNAHLVISEAPALDEDRAPIERRPELLLLSAGSEGALRALAGRQARYLRETAPDPQMLADIAFTTATGRARLPFLLPVVGDDPAAMADGLDAFGRGEASPGLEPLRRPRQPALLAFLFAGQGAQRAGMARQLFEGSPVFREALERCDARLRHQLPGSLVDRLYASNRDEDDALDETLWTQPALFAVEWALCRQWQAWGVEPDLVLGHSLGAWVAASVAGVLDIEDALDLVVLRGRLLQDTAEGAMAAVPASEAQVLEVLGEDRTIDIAAINGPRETVLSGSPEAVEQACARLSQAGIRSRRLRVRRAFHSSLVEPALAPFEAAVAAVPLRPPRRRFVSDSTGRLATDELASPAYWRKHLRQPVRFAEGLSTLRAAGCALFLEIGPGATLSAMGRRVDPQGTFLPSLREKEDPRHSLLQALGQLIGRGVPARPAPIRASEGRRRVALPSTPFERRRHMPGPPAADSLVDPLLGRMLPAAPGEARFEASWRADSLGVLRDHRVQDRIIVSGAVHGALVLRALERLRGEGGHTGAVIEQVEFLSPLLLAEEGSLTVSTHLVEEGEGFRFELSSRDPQGRSRLHSRGRVGHQADASPPRGHDLEALQQRCPEELSGEDFYRRFWRPGEHSLGPSYRIIDRIWRRDGEALARLRPPGPLPDDGRLPPALLRSIGLAEVQGQLLLPLVPDYEAFFLAPGQDFLGSGMRRSLVFGAETTGAAWVHARLDAFDGAEITAEVELLDEQGRVLSRLEGLSARRLPRDLLRGRLVEVPSTDDLAPLDLEALRSLPGPDRRQRLLEQLERRLARVLGARSRLDPDQPLQALGLDSLMALDLRELLSRDLGREAPADLGLRESSPAELADALLASLFPAASAPEPRPSPWLLPIGSPTAESDLQLICLPHAGGSAAVFQPWRPHIPAGLSVHAVQLPGHLGRHDEAPMEDLGPLVRALLQELEPRLRPPFAFFGASLGGLLAFELSRALRRAGLPLPTHLLVAGSPSPELAHPLASQARLLDQALAGDGDLLQLRQLGLLPDVPLDEGILRILVPVLRADLFMVLRHRYEDEPPLPLPITALCGMADPLIHRQHMSPWVAHTETGFSLKMLPGGHLFYRDQPGPMLQALATALLS